MKEQLNNKLYIETMDAIYPNIPPIKDIINSEELLNECEGLIIECAKLYNKGALADLTEEEFKSFVWNIVVKMVDDEQRALFNEIMNK